MVHWAPKEGTQGLCYAFVGKTSFTSTWIWRSCGPTHCAIWPTKTKSSARYVVCVRFLWICCQDMFTLYDIPQNQRTLIIEDTDDLVHACWRWILSDTLTEEQIMQDKVWFMTTNWQLVQAFLDSIEKRMKLTKFLDRWSVGIQENWPFSRELYCRLIRVQWISDQQTRVEFPNDAEDLLQTELLYRRKLMWTPLWFSTKCQWSLCRANY